MTREEAIKTIKANYPSGGYEDLRQALDMAVEALQEQKVGHWEAVYIDTVYGRFQAKNKVCSVCGHPEKYIVAPYCRWCGAKMEGAEE